MNMKNDHSTRLIALLQQGSTLHAQNRLDDAQHLYQQAAQLQPADFRAWYLLGIVALHKNQPRGMRWNTWIARFGSTRAAPRRAPSVETRCRGSIGMRRRSKAIPNRLAWIQITPATFERVY